MVQSCDGLQFGHGCDAVETTSLLLPATTTAVLQFGHGCDAVETPGLHTFGIWLEYPFNSATAVMPWKLRAAFVAFATVSSFNSATSVMPWKPFVSLNWTGRESVLQFGHGCDAVETRFVGLSLSVRRRIPSIRPRL